MIYENNPDSVVSEEARKAKKLPQDLKLFCNQCGQTFAGQDIVKRHDCNIATMKRPLPIMEDPADKIEPPAKQVKNDETIFFCIDCESERGSHREGPVCYHKTHPRCPVLEKDHCKLRGHNKLQPAGDFLLPIREK